MSNKITYNSEDAKELIRKQENKMAFLAMAIAVVILALSVWYSYYQYNLCYPEVSDSFWYCFQHAVGG